MIFYNMQKETVHHFYLMYSFFFLLLQNYLRFLRKSGIWMSFFGTLLVSGACGCGAAAPVPAFGILNFGIWNPLFAAAVLFCSGAADCAAVFFPFVSPFTLACLVVASSRPVAITVIFAASDTLSSYIAPKIIFAFSPARFCT